jgi:hypothetical protein
MNPPKPRRKSKLIRIVAIVLIIPIILASLSTTTAYAATRKETCELASGTWVSEPGTGLPDEHGVCTYGAATATALAFCAANPGYEYVTTWDNTGGYVSDVCVDPGPVLSGSSSGSYIEPEVIKWAKRPESTKNPQNNGSTSTNLNLADGSVNVTFDSDSCSQQCTISRQLPRSARNSLPSDVAATLYVRVVDSGGNPGNGSYNACFANNSGNSLTIYKFISGAWVAQATSSSNPICVNSSGDGAFYLG